MITMLSALWLIASGPVISHTATATINVGPLVGTWTCHGHFVKSGRLLDAKVEIVRSDVAGTLLVNHRDVPPGTYRSAEIWSLSSQVVRAAVVDATGMRWFEGLIDEGNVVFTRDAEGKPFEQFVYRLSSGGLTIDWSYLNASGALTLGDTLSCRR